MSSVWECSRNDIASNIGVIAAAVVVAFLEHGWPDLLVGVFLATLFLTSAIRVLLRARTALRHPAAIG